MNISKNSIIIDNFKNNIIKHKNISGNLNFSGVENTQFSDSNNSIILKSDSYLASSIQPNSTADLAALVKKILYNENFREIVINSDSRLREVYENFIEAIRVDNSNIAEYIKSVIDDYGKFSGEFFDALNELMSSTKDLSLKNAIYDFLKIYDYYFSQDENASAVNSSLNDLLNRLPEELKNQLLKLLSSSFKNSLDFFLFSILDTKLPEKEKLRIIISYLLDFTDKYSSLKDNANILENLVLKKDFEEDVIRKNLHSLRLSTHSSTKANDEVLRFTDAAIKSLKNTNFDVEIKNLTETLEEKLEELNLLKGADISDQFISNYSLSEVKSSILALNELIQSISEQKSASLNNLHSVDDIIKFLDNLKSLSSFDDKNIINSILSDLEKLNFHNPSELTSIFDRINKHILNNSSYSNDIKENLLNLIDTFADNTLGKLIFSNLNNNKAEVLLNIYEKNIIPSLLKNTEQFNPEQNSSRYSLSSLTHNLLRLKLGTANEFDKQTKTFFNQLNYKQLIDQEQSINMKLGLIDKIVEQRESNSGMNTFLRLLDFGIRLNFNEINRATFENILLSLLSRNNDMSSSKNFFFPILYNEQKALSEIIFNKEKVEDDGKKQEDKSSDSALRITMILDVENKGVFNTSLVYSAGEISANIIIPKYFSSSSLKIHNDIKAIIEKNNIKAKSILVSES